jgi:structural maintenance of chromosome 3 (chondroitin sulfate proteoglycan 6)
VLALIEERLGELEREKTELTEYEELDRQRRALDYSLYEKQHAKVSFGCQIPPCLISPEPPGVW